MLRKSTNIVIIRSDQAIDQWVGRTIVEVKVLSSIWKTVLLGARRSILRKRELNLLLEIPTGKSVISSSPPWGDAVWFCVTCEDDFVIELRVGFPVRETLCGCMPSDQRVAISSIASLSYRQYWRQLKVDLTKTYII